MSRHNQISNETTIFGCAMHPWATVVFLQMGVIFNESHFFKRVNFSHKYHFQTSLVFSNESFLKRVTFLKTSIETSNI